MTSYMFSFQFGSRESQFYLCFRLLVTSLISEDRSLAADQICAIYLNLRYYYRRFRFSRLPHHRHAILHWLHNFIDIGPSATES